MTLSPHASVRPETHGVQLRAAPAPEKTPVSPERRARRRLPIVQSVFTVTVLTVLGLGWLGRDADYTVAGEGLGYGLGIAGGVMMVALLLYPLRKQAGFMRNWGALRHWFRWHMLFGILGPVAILFHCNFHLGATNSNVALFSMLVVASSGLIGRYVYAKIHFGLYGRRATLDELQTRSGLIEGAIQGALAQAPDVVQQIQSFRTLATCPYRNALSGFGMLLMLGFAARYTRRRSVRALRCWIGQQALTQAWDRQVAKQQFSSQRQLIERCIVSLRDVAEFSAYERLFALWHVFHIPLFFMLLIAGIAHVVAVGIY